MKNIFIYGCFFLCIILLFIAYNKISEAKYFVLGMKTAGNNTYLCGLLNKTETVDGYCDLGKTSGYIYKIKCKYMADLQMRINSTYIPWNPKDELVLWIFGCKIQKFGG